MKLSRSDVQLETIVSRIFRDDLDLQPNFQRGEIWDNRRRQRLIDSILRKWYVPAVHIVRDPDENETVLDGQQRLAAIRDFFANRFAVDGSTEPASPEIQKLHGLTFDELPGDVRRSVERFPLTCVTLEDFNPGEPNELFFRLNQSYNLTPSEKRNALHGPARGQVKEVVKSLQTAGLLTHEAIGFSNNRLAYDDIIARTCLALERRNLKLHINNNVVEAFYREEMFSQDTIDGVIGAGQTLAAMTSRVDDRLRLNKATLFSWIVFCYWAPRVAGDPLNLDALNLLEQNRKKIKLDTGTTELAPELIAPIALYDDRASYRVTDVSSVLARDVVLYLHYSFYFSIPEILNVRTLTRDISKSSESQAQQRILDYVSSTGWGDLTKIAIH